mgnify:CR=1 FL=1
MHMRGGQKAIHTVGGAQGIGHQRAAPRAELDQAHHFGAAHLGPDMGAPKTNQLAEHLADLGRGDEITGPAQGIAGHVVTKFRMRQSLCHIVIEAERAFGANTAPDMVEKRRQTRGPGRQIK